MRSRRSSAAVAVTEPPARDPSRPSKADARAELERRRRAAEVAATRAVPAVPREAIPERHPAANPQGRPVRTEERSSAPEVSEDDVLSVQDAVALARRAHIALCREDVNAFCEYVLRDEETGEPIEQHAMHVRMQHAIDRHRTVVIMAHPESGKSNQIGVGRVLWELGRDPNKHVVLVGNTQGDAQNTLEAIRRYIEKSPELHEVFPGLKRDPDGTWNTSEITVVRSVVSRFSSIQTVGVHGNINGARVDIVVADDVIDMENTKTAANRRDVSKWFRTHVLTRMRGDGTSGWCAFLANAWHPDDLAHELVTHRGFKMLRFPVLLPTGESNWPAKWSHSKIATYRKRLGELEFTQLYLCKPRDEGAQIFTPESLARCRKRGLGYGLLSWLDERAVPAGSLIVTAVDLAVTRRASGAVTCVFTLFIHPNGDRQPIGIRSGRWSGKQILEQIAAAVDAYGGVVVVEDNAQQKYLLDLVHQTGVEINASVVPFETGRNKSDVELGIDAMAAEFDAGRWIVPVGKSNQPTPEIEKWLAELEAYDPSVHSGDRLMASWIARTYAMRVLRRAKRPDGGVRVISASRSAERDQDTGAISLRDKVISRRGTKRGLRVRSAA